MSKEVEEFIGNLSDETDVDQDKVEEIVDKTLGFVLKKKIERTGSEPEGFGFGTDDYNYNE